MPENHNNHRTERVNQIKSAVESLTVEELCGVLAIKGLRRSGERYRGNCPIHGGDSKSFTIYRDNARIVWNCPTSCGSGNVFYLGAHMLGIGTNLKGRNWISLLNKFAQAMGLPAVGGGELTAAQLLEIEERSKRLKDERERVAAEEAVLFERTNLVLTELMKELTLENREIEYLRGRGIVTCGVQEARARLIAAGVRSFDRRALKALTEEFSADDLRHVLGDGRKLLEQFEKRPLLMFTANSDHMITGCQARSIDPHCQKEYRFISRGKIAGGFFNGIEFADHTNKPVVCVEGMTDLLACLMHYAKLERSIGRESVVIGKAGAGKMSEQVAKQFKGREVTFIFDDDEAGRAGASSCASIAGKHASAAFYTTVQGGDISEVLTK